MSHLTFQKARTFLYRNARPLDLARFQYHFEKGNKEKVLNVLSYYQNEDGGCGHALECDCWNPNSTPLHTGTACDIIQEIDVTDRKHPVVQGLLNWYASGEYFNGKHWSITVPSNNDYPHAPWWHTESISSYHTDYNGTAQIAGFLVRYAERGSELFQLGVRIVNEAIDALLQSDITDMHTCACYVKMKESMEKAKVTDLCPYETLTQKLQESVHRLITADKSKWNAYVCKPSQFLTSRDSEYYEANKEIAEYECKFIMDTQLDDGSWDIPWKWDDFPEEWNISKNWWKGSVILTNLLYLKEFGML